MQAVLLYVAPLIGSLSKCKNVNFHMQISRKLFGLGIGYTTSNLFRMTRRMEIIENIQGGPFKKTKLILLFGFP